MIVVCNTAGLAAPRPLPNLSVYRSLHAGFQLASPSVVIAAAAAAAAALKSSSSALDHHDSCTPVAPLPRAPETPCSMESSPATVAAPVTCCRLMSSASLPLFSPSHHPLLPTLGFTLEQVRVQHQMNRDSNSRRGSRRRFCLSCPQLSKYENYGKGANCVALQLEAAVLPVGLRYNRDRICRRPIMHLHTKFQRNRTVRG